MEWIFRFSVRGIRAKCPDTEQQNNHERTDETEFLSYRRKYIIRMCCRKIVQFLEPLPYPNAKKTSISESHHALNNLESAVEGLFPRIKKRQISSKPVTGLNNDKKEEGKVKADDDADPKDRPAYRKAAIDMVTTYRNLGIA